VTGWPRFFDRDQAITALTITELLETGCTRDDPLVTALREELRSRPRAGGRWSPARSAARTAAPGHAPCADRHWEVRPHLPRSTHASRR
jgi:hypothetical protein